MPLKIGIPSGCDLTLTCHQIARIYGVSPSTAYRWKKAGEVPMRRGSRGVREMSLGLWQLLKRSDWEQGYPHVGRLIGVSPQAVHQMRERLVKAGYDIPKLPRGRHSGR